jgi:sRNA-binding carbon storage regulator CsrA
MLVLTRGIGEKIIAMVPPSTEPTPIEILVVDVRTRAKHARIGITASPAVAIHRSEVQERIAQGGTDVVAPSHASGADEAPGTDGGVPEASSAGG